jgi:hypothetical protein
VNQGSEMNSPRTDSEITTREEEEEEDEKFTNSTVVIAVKG